MVRIGIHKRRCGWIAVGPIAEGQCYLDASGCRGKSWLGLFLRYHMATTSLTSDDALALSFAANESESAGNCFISFHCG